MGKAFLFKISDDQVPPNYRTLAGLRENEMSIDGGTMNIRATGIFLGQDAENTLRQRALSGQVAPYELLFEDGNRMRGELLILRLDYAGEFYGERNYSVTMSSVGAMVPA